MHLILFVVPSDELTHPTLPNITVIKFTLLLVVKVCHLASTVLESYHPTVIKENISVTASGTVNPGHWRTPQLYVSRVLCSPHYYIPHCVSERNILCAFMRNKVCP